MDKKYWNNVFKARKEIYDMMMELGVSMIAEELENYDEYLRQNKQCRPLWHIVRRDRTSLLTSLGTVTYHKTLFRNRKPGHMNTCWTVSWGWNRMQG